jgi:hypothetical protein
MQRLLGRVAYEWLVGLSCADCGLGVQTTMARLFIVAGLHAPMLAKTLGVWTAHRSEANLDEARTRLSFNLRASAFARHRAR